MKCFEKTITLPTGDIASCWVVRKIEINLSRYGTLFDGSIIIDGWVSDSAWKNGENKTATIIIPVADVSVMPSYAQVFTDVMSAIASDNSFVGATVKDI